jgi:sulfatase maturation enzyme AslB (radical SAM superfamily)
METYRENPFTFTLELTERCNLACKYCYVPKGSNCIISEEVLLATIEQIKKKIDEGLAALAGEFENVIKAQKRTANDPVELICDKGTQWQYIAKLYNVLFGMGIKNITFRMGE